MGVATGLGYDRAPVRDLLGQRVLVREPGGEVYVQLVAEGTKRRLRDVRNDGQA